MATKLETQQAKALRLARRALAATKKRVAAKKRAAKKRAPAKKKRAAKKRTPRKRVINGPEVSTLQLKALYGAKALGLSDYTASALSGIKYPTIRTWRTKAEAGETPWATDIVDEMNKAEATCLGSALGTINNAAKTDWRAARWLSERLDRERFGSKQHLELDGKVDAPGVVILPVMEIPEEEEDDDE